jgi:prepilin-type N-terminal cleavage/methylation domain-containing protein/prepilin-type processing-associated H-X9-DG protein
MSLPPLHTFKAFFTRPRGCRGAAFTLIELIVVIAIIGIMAALALPYLQSSITRAQIATCSNKIKHLATGILLYENDNNGYLPPNNAHSAGTAPTTWSFAIRPYLGIVGLDTTGSATMQMMKILTCPLARAGDVPTNWWESDFAVSLAFGTDGTSRHANLQKASTTDMLIESTNGDRSIYVTPPPLSAVGFRHQNASPAAFFDGHVELRSSSNVPSSFSDPFWGYVP